MGEESKTSLIDAKLSKRDNVRVGYNTYAYQSLEVVMALYHLRHRLEIQETYSHRH